jgi:sulfite exporter TauE/SafE
LAIALAFFFFERSSLRLRFALGTSYVFIAVGYFLAALSKLRNGGLGWIDPDNFQMMISVNQVHKIARDQSFAFNALQQLVMSYDFIGTLILALGLIIELSAILLCFRRFRMYSATAILLMHLGVIAAMNIYFPWNMSLLLLLGYPWAVLIESKRFHVTASTAGASPSAVQRN